MDEHPYQAKKYYVSTPANLSKSKRGQDAELCFTNQEYKHMLYFLGCVRYF